MPATMTKELQEQLNLLHAITEGTLDEYLDSNQTDLSHDIARELHEDGMFRSNPFKPIAGRPSYPDAKITSRGRAQIAELEQLAIPDQAANPPDSEPPNLKKQLDEPWYKRPWGDIGLGLVKGLLVLGAAWAIAHWWNVLLSVFE